MFDFSAIVLVTWLIFYPMNAIDANDHFQPSLEVKRTGTGLKLSWVEHSGMIIQRNNYSTTHPMEEQLLEIESGHGI